MLCLALILFVIKNALYIDSSILNKSHLRNKIFFLEFRTFGIKKAKTKMFYFFRYHRKNLKDFYLYQSLHYSGHS